MKKEVKKTQRSKDLRGLRTMKEGEFEKIITEHNKKAKDLSPNIVELPKTKNGNIVDEIDKKDITFVVSGGHSHQNFDLKSSLFFIRRVFPESKIILSTWDDFDEKTQEKYNGLYDELILSSQNELPWRYIAYTFADSGDCRENAFNHQQLLNSRGLDAVKTKYVVKTRTDLWIQSDYFVKKYIDSVNSVTFVDENFRLFKQRVLCDNTFFHNPITTKRPFFFSDIFLFGLTEDIKKIFSYYVLPKDVALYFHDTDEATKQIIKNDYFYSQTRYFVEEYNLISALLNNDVKYRLPYDALDNSKEIKNNSVRCLANNFFVSSFLTLGIFSKFYYLATTQGYNVTAKVLNTYIADIFNVAISQKLTYYAQEDEYEQLRSEVNKKIEKMKQRSVIIYPLARCITRFIKTIGYVFSILKRYPVMLIVNYKRHKLKHKLKS